MSSRCTRFAIFQIEPGIFEKIILTRLENGRFIVTVPTVQVSSELSEDELDSWVRSNLNTNVQFKEEY